MYTSFKLFIQETGRMTFVDNISAMKTVADEVKYLGTSRIYNRISRDYSLKDYK